MAESWVLSFCFSCFFFFGVFVVLFFVLFPTTLCGVLVFLHNFVWGSCFWFSIPGSSSASSSARPSSLTHIFVHHTMLHTPSSTFPCTTLSTIFVNHHLSHTYLSTIFVNHHLSHTYFNPFQLYHTQLCQPSLSTTIFHIHISTIFVKHHLSHTCQPPSFTYIFVKPSVAYISVKPSVSTIFVNHLCQPPSFTYMFLKPSVAALCVAGVALGDIDLRFAWQAWHLWRWVARLDHISRGWRRGTLRGRRGTRRRSPSFCVAGVALMALGGALGPD